VGLDVEYVSCSTSLSFPQWQRSYGRNGFCNGMPAKATLTPFRRELQPWRDRYLVFGAPHIGAEERAEVQACVDSSWLGTGPRVARLESDFRDYIRAPDAVAVSSCTAALHLALLAARLEPGSEVITTAMTFCATANAIVHAGCVPVFADCDRATMNVDLEDVATKITDRTRAIMVVHFAGRPCDMGRLLDLAEAHSLRVIEDCAHAIESTVNGHHCGTFGDFGCFSFYITKNMTTIEGGMVVARNQQDTDRIRVLALHGMTKDAWRRYTNDGFVHYDVVEPGFKYNLTDLAASFGLHQLARLEANWLRRRELWDFYMKELSDLPLVLPSQRPEGQRHALHLFTCLVDDRLTALTRDQLLQALHELRIGTGVHYRALHLHDYYRRTFGNRIGRLPNAEYISARTFSIPLSPAVSDRDAADVVRALRIVLT
jgi:dTDP-4-amino-4,6-dideoxygalactose transaminase